MPYAPALRGRGGREERRGEGAAVVQKSPHPQPVLSLTPSRPRPPGRDPPAPHGRAQQPSRWVYLNCHLLCAASIHRHRRHFPGGDRPRGCPAPAVRAEPAGSSPRRRAWGRRGVARPLAWEGGKPRRGKCRSSPGGALGDGTLPSPSPLGPSGSPPAAPAWPGKRLCRSPPPSLQF